MGASAATAAVATATAVTAKAATKGKGDDKGAPFPKGFVWGAATAAYQIEGAADEDGGAGGWDVFCKRRARSSRATPATSPATTTTAIKEDVALMQELGVQAYRFSVSWPRVLPEGTRRGQPEGARLLQTGCIDELLEAGIRRCARCSTGTTRRRSTSAAAG